MAGPPYAHLNWKHAHGTRHRSIREQFVPVLPAHATNIKLIPVECDMSMQQAQRTHSHKMRQRTLSRARMNARMEA